jgi:hypothetical protein
VSQPIETSALQPAETVVVALVLGGEGFSLAIIAHMHKRL